MKSALSPQNRSDLAQQCVKCGLCLPHCPTYAIAQNEAESPRGRIALMAAMAQNPGLYGSADLPSLDNCLACRRCETACPAHVSYDALLIGTRNAVKPALPLQAKAALWLMAHKPWLNGLLALYRFSFKALPQRMKILPAPGSARPITTSASRSAVFSGCVADTYEHGVRLALLRLLQAAGESAEIPTAQVCCGQAALHAGDGHSAQRLAQGNQRAFAGYDRLLVLASGCFSALEQSAGLPVLDACVYLQRNSAALRFNAARDVHVALHTPCSASFHHQGDASLALLRLIPDLRITLLADQGCCGAAGLHQLAQPERATRLAGPTLAAAQASGATVLLSQNIGCRLHLAKGLHMPVLHPIEFMAQFLHDIPTPTDPH
ncbi:MAG TPA: (Fe-S)-binding protein [Arenimonas sp.]|nr:(Fe-S)-binding protein [Arenimonas sp.]